MKKVLETNIESQNDVKLERCEQNYCTGWMSSSLQLDYGYLTFFSEKRELYICMCTYVHVRNVNMIRIHTADDQLKIWAQDQAYGGRRKTRHAFVYFFSFFFILLLVLSSFKLILLSFFFFIPVRFSKGLLLFVRVQALFWLFSSVIKTIFALCSYIFNRSFVQLLFFTYKFIENIFSLSNAYTGAWTIRR